MKQIKVLTPRQSRLADFYLRMADDELSPKPPEVIFGDIIMYYKSDRVCIILLRTDCGRYFHIGTSMGVFCCNRHFLFMENFTRLKISVRKTEMDEEQRDCLGFDLYAISGIDNHMNNGI